ncbi:MAG: CorA family divalent cation transporter, partial [Nitrospirota bacterium]
LTEERPTTEWLQDRVIRWFDVDYTEPAQDLEQVLAPFKLSPELLEEIEAQESGVKVETFQQALLIRMPGQAKSILDDHYIALICVGATIITLHRGSILTPEEITEKLKRIGLSGSTDLPNLVLHIFMMVMKLDFEFYQETRKEIDGLSHRMDQDLTINVLDKIRNLTNQVGRLQSATEDRIILTGAILTLKNHILDLNEVRPNLKEALEVLKQLKRWLEHQEKRLHGISQHFELSLQHNTDTRLRVLTVISAIFLPLTLIAGIYGMNFQYMPELQGHWAYFIVLTSMALLGGGLALWFYRRGWFR